MTTKAREAKLEYLKEERDRLCANDPVNQVEVNILTERIWEILEEQKGRTL
jgi:hypothetical protein